VFYFNIIYLKRFNYEKSALSSNDLALELYGQSLAIAEKQSDVSGVASSQA